MTPPTPGREHEIGPAGGHNFPKGAPMLSRDQNELLSRVGRGTPMGELIRRFWIPAAAAQEVKEPDGVPVRLRIMGEDLVAFRDTKGRVGVVRAYCSHRLAPLFL